MKEFIESVKYLLKDIEGVNTNYIVKNILKDFQDENVEILEGLENVCNRRNITGENKELSEFVNK